MDISIKFFSHVSIRSLEDNHVLQHRSTVKETSMTGTPMALIRSLSLGYHFFVVHITKSYLYNFDLFKPHFYIVKLQSTVVYIIFLISAQKHRLWVLIRTASGEAVLTRTHNFCFEQKYEKNIRIFF